MPPDEPVQQPSVAITVDNPPATPAPPADSELRSEVEKVSNRVDEIQSSITEQLESTRTWTTEQIQPLLQELADLKANSKVATENLIAQIADIQDTLTRLSQEPPEEPPVISSVILTPPETPPDGQDKEGDIKPIAGATGASPSAQPGQPKPNRKRVV